MATKNEVISKIDAIVDNGNNSAAKVRNVLKEILDFTENAPPAANPDGGVKLFGFEGIVQDKAKNSRLTYSFRGIEGHHVNFTFRFEAINPNPTANLLLFEYAFPKIEFDHLVNVMKPTGPQSAINFFVPMEAEGQGSGFFRGIRMGISINNDGRLVLDFNNPKSEFRFSKGDTIYTSVHFHSPFGE